MITTFPKTLSYLNSIEANSSDPLDQKAKQLLYDEEAYERASQALRRRFSRGAEVVEGVDKAGRYIRSKREKQGGKYHY